MSEEYIDPFGDIIDGGKNEEEDHPDEVVEYVFTQDIPKQATPLDRFKLNVMEIMKTPISVKKHLIERGLATLKMIETNPEFEADPRWVAIYERMLSNTQREVEKLDAIWKDMYGSRADHDKLKAFDSIETFLEFLKKVAEIYEIHEDELYEDFTTFLQKKGLFSTEDNS